MVSKFFGFVAGATLLAAPAASFAQYFETEANNTFATGNFFSRGLFPPDGAIAIDGHIEPGDVDFFRVDLLAGDWVSLFVATRDPSSEDTVLGIFAPDGSLFDFNDDAFGLNSAWTGTITEDGVWGFAVTGFPDFDFVGRHDFSFDYKLTIGLNPVVPEPATMTAVAAGLAALALRRRKK